MFSDTPGTPGHQAADAADVEVDGTPACDARYSARMQRRSTSELSFIAIRAGLPSSCAATVRSISAIIPSRRKLGATSTLR